MRNLAARVRDLLLDNADGLSSLATSLSTIVELLEGRIDVVAANEVHWGTWCALIAALSHISELKSELELLGSEGNKKLTEDQADALWTQVRTT
jgi:hypothetical protein